MLPFVPESFVFPFLIQINIDQYIANRDISRCFTYSRCDSWCVTFSEGCRLAVFEIGCYGRYRSIKGRKTEYKVNKAALRQTGEQRYGFTRP